MATLNLPVKTDIYWTRHLFSCANSLANIGKINRVIYRSITSNPHISNVGLIHGEKIMKQNNYFSNNKIDLIICSQLLRTIETASIMFSDYYSNKLPIIVAPFINEESSIGDITKENIPEDYKTTFQKYSQYIDYQNKNKKYIMQFNLEYVDQDGNFINFLDSKETDKWFNKTPDYKRFIQILDNIVRNFISRYNRKIDNSRPFNIVVVSHSQFIFKNIIAKKAIINQDITDLLNKNNKNNAKNNAIREYIKNAGDKHRYYYNSDKYYLSIYKKVYNGDIIKRSQFNNTIEYIQPLNKDPSNFIKSDFFKIKKEYYDIGRKEIVADILFNFFNTEINRTQDYKLINYIVFGFCGFNDIKYREILTYLILDNKKINKQKIDKYKIDNFLNKIYRELYNPLYNILKKDLKTIAVDTGRLKGKGEGGITPMIWFLKRDGSPDKGKIGKLLPKYFDGWDNKSIDEQIKINMENREVIFYHNISKREILYRYIPEYYGICNYNSKKYFIMGDISGKYSSYRKFDFKIGTSTRYLSDSSMNYMRSLKDYEKVVEHLFHNRLLSYSNKTGARLEVDSISTDVRPKNEENIKNFEADKAIITKFIGDLPNTVENKKEIESILEFDINDTSTAAKRESYQLGLFKVGEKRHNKWRNPLNIIRIIKNRAPFSYKSFVMNYLKFIDEFLKPNYYRTVATPYSYAFIGSSLLITIGNYYSPSPEIEFNLIDFAHVHKWDNINDLPVLFNGEPLITKNIFDDFLKNYTTGLLNIGLMLLALLEEEIGDDDTKIKFLDFYLNFNKFGTYKSASNDKRFQKNLNNKDISDHKLNVAVHSLAHHYYNSLSRGGIRIKTNENLNSYYKAIIQHFEYLLDNNAKFKENIIYLMKTNDINNNNKYILLKQIIKDPNSNITKSAESSSTLNNKVIVSLPKNISNIINVTVTNPDNKGFINFILKYFLKSIKDQGLMIKSNEDKKLLESKYIDKFINNANSIKLHKTNTDVENKIRRYRIGTKVKRVKPVKTVKTVKTDNESSSVTKV